MKAGGYSWEKVGKIWYIALEDRLREYSNFKMLQIILTILQDHFSEKSAFCAFNYNGIRIS
jgi:Zn-dependent metalloprotease